MIKGFKIKKLFGSIDVDIPFEDDCIKILIGENGLGKTTVLNIMYHCLRKNYMKLSQFEFESIEINFSTESASLSFENINKLNFLDVDNRVTQEIPSSTVSRHI